MIKNVGAILTGNTCRFTVWAPEKENISLQIVAPVERTIRLTKNDWGYFSATVDDIGAGTRYLYEIDGETFPDPASHSQPEGVHGPSEVVDPTFPWTDAPWQGIPRNELILYELHIGTFTHEGTFDAVIPRLDDLLETGINAIEIMPVAQFPGRRNWGYDGVFPYAVQNSYGGPQGLKRLVDACHRKGIAVILDVVYNHLGPEGNYLHRFAPYFTNKYKTPWGDAINYDGPWSDGVRNYFCGNAIYWLRDFHIDGLRLDAVHEMYDFGAIHFWEYLHDMIKVEEQRSGRYCLLVAESDLNNPRIIQHPEAGGYGFNAQWLDDFHHALYTLLDKKGVKRYCDFGSIAQLAKAYTDGFVHSGDYVRFRKKRYGRSSAGIPGDKFIIFNQNHDQVGNRFDAARLSSLVSFPLQKIAAAAIMLSPYVPMLFMGEEYGEAAPFTYFIDHSDEQLVEAVRRGRKEEFAADGWDTDPPDPYAQETFESCILNWHRRTTGSHHQLQLWHKELIALRRSHAALKNFNKNDVRVHITGDSSFLLHRKCDDGDEQLLAVFNLSEKEVTLNYEKLLTGWQKILDSAAFTADATGSPMPSALNGSSLTMPGETVAVYERHKL